MTGLRGQARAMVRPRGLRLRVLLVVIAVAALPVLVVWATDLADATVGQRLELSLTTVTNRTLSALEAGTPVDQAVSENASKSRARITIVAPDGQIIASADHAAATTWTGRIVQTAFQEDGAPSLDEIEALRPPIERREEISRARVESHVSGCLENADKRIIACHSARAAPVGVVYAQRSARLPIRALYDARFQLLKVSLLVALAALLAGLWLGGRMMRPLHSLRFQVLDRVDRPLSAPDVVLPRDDEFGDLAQAFNHLLAEVRHSSAQNEAFVADLAHEMKNPVAAIRAASESLAGSAELTDTRAARIARILDDSSRRLDALVTQLLELARAEAGLLSEQRVAVDVSALLSGLMDAARSDSRNEHVRLRGDLAQASVMAGPSSLETALRNVLTNALSFAASEVTVRVEIGSAVHIYVEDDGPGFPEDAMERVFDRFYTSRGATIGTGLGLALTRAIVEAHHGEVKAENTDPGARVVLSLPSSS